MKKNYDFSKGIKNPYYKKIKGKKYEIVEDVSFDLNDLIKPEKKDRLKKKSLSKSEFKKSHVKY